MGKNVKNHIPGEDWQLDSNGVPQLQGFSFSLSQGSPASHTNSPPVSAASWATLKTKAAQGAVAFDAEATSAWGAWWTARTTAEQGHIRTIMAATSV